MGDALCVCSLLKLCDRSFAVVLHVLEFRKCKALCSLTIGCDVMRASALTSAGLRQHLISVVHLSGRASVNIFDSRLNQRGAQVGEVNSQAGRASLLSAALKVYLLDMGAQCLLLLL